MRAPRHLVFDLLRVSTFALAAAVGVPVAHAQTVINNQTVTVPPATIPSGNNLTVGSTGTGVLNIVTGGVVTTSLSTLGASAGSSGTVNVSGTGQWTSGNLTIGSQGAGFLNITGGGNVTTTSSTTLGSFVSGSGNATVDGATSLWTMGGSLYLGDSGDSILSVTNGATVTATGQTFYIANDDGTGTLNVSGGSTVTNGFTYVGYCGGGCSTSEGIANISGAGTTLNSASGIYVGYEDSEGTLNISAGAAVTAGGDLVVGYFSDSPGHVSVTGSGSQLVLTGIADAYIGLYSSADVTVSNGASFTAARDTYISYGAGSDSSLTITGAGSEFTATGGSLYVGYAGDGAMSILAGATATTGTTIVGDAAGSTGTVTVSGSGSVWNSGELTIGSHGLGQLNITNGGVVNGSNNATVGYYGAGSSATVSGTGSQWNLGSNSLDVGYYTNASVTVTDNAVLTAGDVTIGYGADGQGVVNVTNGGKIYSDAVTLGDYGHNMSGTMNISGAGSEWHVTDSITAVNDYGVGIINVTSGGLLTVGSNLYLGSYGNYPDDYAEMTVSGTGTRVEIGGTSYIGYGAVASLTVTNNAQFTTDELAVGPYEVGTMTIGNGAVVTATTATTVGEYGTLIFGAAANEAPAATGTLSTPTLTFTSGSGGTIVFNHTNNLTFGAALASSSLGYGDIQVLSGTTTFTAGSGAYSGNVEVTGGKAVFNANVGGNVEVSGSGIVGGSGTISSLDALSGGTVSPGNSPGTLNVVGNVSFASGSTYVVEVSGAQHDLISAGGTGALSGGTVQVSGSPSLMQYTILTATGGVTGTLDGVNSTSAFVLYSLDYDLNNVYLLIDGYNALTTAARTPNQYAVARALDQFPTDNPLYSAVIGGSVSNAQQAFNALSGEIHASVGSALADDSRYVREAITGRLIQAYYGGGGAGGGQPIVLAAGAPNDVATIDTSSRMSLGAGYGSSREAAPSGGHNLAYWSRAFGAWGEYNTNGNAATTDRNLGGFITGVDGVLGGGWRAGLATGYMYTGLSVDDRWSSAHANSYVLGGYAGGALGHGFALRSGGTWTWNDIETSRNVVFPGFNEFESASYNGNVGQLFAELAYPIFSHDVVVEPFAGLAYVHVGTDGFTESGPVAGLTSGGLDMNLGYGTLGARVGSTWLWGATTVVPHASLAWQYAFGDTTPEQALAFASTGIGMGIGGVPLADNSALVEVGADAVIARDATLGLSYIGQYSGDFIDTGLRGRFNWKF